MRKLQAGLIGGVALAMLGGAAFAQGAYKAPRTVDGQPDLQGAWTNSTLTPFERPASLGERRAYTEAEAKKIEADRAEIVRIGNEPTVGVFDLNAPCHAANENEDSRRGAFTESNCGYNSGWVDHGDTVMRVNGEPRTSMVTYPANGRAPAMLPRPPRPQPPARPAGAPPVGAGGRGGSADNPENRSLGDRCITSFGNHAGPVMLPSFYNSNYQIVQSKDAVAILVEMVHDTRIIRLHAEHGTLRPYYGDSIGRFEGDTLVVETTGYHPRQNFRGASENLKVTERFTRVGPTRILYQFKVEDPTVWAEPWGGEYELTPAKGPVFEYACHEGNYGLQNILAGARMEEAEEARRAQAPPTAGRQ